MAFFKSFQENLSSVSSLLDSVTDAVDDLAFAVGDVTLAVSDQLAEQVNGLLQRRQEQEEERLRSVQRAEAVERAAREAEREAELLREMRLQRRGSQDTAGSALSTETFSTCSDLSQSAEGGREGGGARGERASARERKKPAAPDAGGIVHTRSNAERRSGKKGGRGASNGNEGGRRASSKADDPSRKEWNRRNSGKGEMAS